MRKNDTKKKDKGSTFCIHRKIYSLQQAPDHAERTA